MANSAKGSGNLLVPLAVVAVLVVGALVMTFGFSNEEVPAEATVIAEDDVDERPAGAGTVAEGEADEAVEGATDQADDVEPVAPGEENIPAADAAEEGADGAAEGEAEADEALAGTADEPVVQGTSPEETPTNGEGSDTEAARLVNEGESGTDGAQEDGDAAEAGVDSTSGSDGTLPEGRDAQTDLRPEPGQDVVRDTDDGGAAFVPTPAGPEARDD